MNFHTLEKGNPSHSAVICIHGLLGSARNLYRLVDAIAAERFYAIAYDQRGHGHTPHAKDYSLASLAGDIFTLMHSKGIERAHLVGHSLGARVSLAATALQPSKVLSLCMLDSGIRVNPDHLSSLHEIIDPLPDHFKNRSEAELALSHHSAMLKQFLLSNLRASNEPPYWLRWIFDLKAIREELLKAIQIDQTENWRSVKCPALIVRGEHSESLRPEDLAEMLRLNPRAQSAEIENAGHWVHAENFKQTSETVIQFLRKGAT